MSTTTTAPAGTRPAISPLKQLLRLTRTEFTLFVRYKTAWMFLGLPVFLAVVTLQMPNDEVLPGFGMADMTMVASIGTITLILGMGHPSNVFTARRESLVLKRLRVSGVPQAVIFGAVTAIVILFSLALAALVAALVFAASGALPRDPLMLLVAVLLSGVMYSLMGLLVTPLVRNAEAAQMAVMVPMMILLFAGGGVIPLEFLPEAARQAMTLVPSTSVSTLVQAAYTGHDVFTGFAGAEERSYPGLWAAALPSLGAVLAWTAVMGLLVRRYFRWDPRQP
ncbi:MULTISPECIES: ABC transporter permease [unclassified Nocardiopsis]|uniref:ABC transporter permease n=1 Tax=unclassified Nocardiopsis TaxID=2649073 RepID=UPI001357E237|nr:MULTISPECIES: ABC transporter permease [unclassified Nocardiopsis]